MSDSTIQDTLNQLSTSLTTLETSLAPLLSTPFTELVQAQTDPLPKAKLHVLLTYAVHDLIWVYLKTSGVDPATHPVMQEIERLKGYFAKLKSAESPSSAVPNPSTPSIASGSSRMAIDRGAASRFISAAIGGQGRREASGTHTRFYAEQAEGGEGGEDSEDVEAVDEQVEKLLEEQEDESEDEEDQEEKEVESEGSKRKGKGKASPVTKRTKMDPFAGYDQPKPSPRTTSKSISAPSPAVATSKSKRKDRQTAMDVAEANVVPVLSSNEKKKDKKDKKDKKKKSLKMK